MFPMQNDEVITNFITCYTCESCKKLPLRAELGAIDRSLDRKTMTGIILYC